MLRPLPISPRVSSGLLLLRIGILLLAAGGAWLVRCPQQFPWPLLLLGGWLLSVGGGHAITKAHPGLLAVWQRRLAMVDLFWATLLSVVAVWQHGVPLYFPLYLLGIAAGVACWGRWGALAAGSGGALVVGVLSTLPGTPPRSWAAALLLLGGAVLATLVVGAWPRQWSRPRDLAPVAPPLRAVESPR